MSRFELSGLAARLRVFARTRLMPGRAGFRDARGRLVGALARSSHDFTQDATGNVAIIFAFSLLPVVGIAGLGVDYGIAFSAKSRLDNAADAAALAAVVTAKAYAAEHASDADVSTAAIAAGLDRAKRAFAANAGRVAFTDVPTPVIDLKRSGQTFKSSVVYQTTAATQFGRMFGVGTSGVKGQTAASADMPSYLDFYLLLDESGSMGIPTAAADQTTLASVNDGCQFACHYSDSYEAASVSAGKWGYNIALAGYTKKKLADGTYGNDKQVLTKPLQLRTGAVNVAICQLLTRASNPLIPEQYRVGLYPFVTQVSTLADVTSDMASLKTYADCASNPPKKLTTLLDTGETQLAPGGNPALGIGSGGTHFEYAMPGIQTLVKTIGDGSTKLTPKPYVFLVTDGLQNNQFFGVKSGSNYLYVGNPNVNYKTYTSSDSSFTGSSPQQIDLTRCATLKASGVTLSILYIPYVPLAVSANGTSSETTKVNSLIPQISTNLQSCASSGFFYTASSQADITNALNAMFNQAIQVAHLSK